MTFTIDASELTDAVDALDAQLDDVLDPIAGDGVAGMADASQARIRELAARHSRTGHMVRNVRQEDQGGSGLASHVRVRATGMVAPILIGGSRAHLIAPVRGHALALRGLGGFRFAGGAVRHPGTRPDPFVKRGADAAQGDIGAVTDQAARRAADQLAATAEG